MRAGCGQPNRGQPCLALVRTFDPSGPLQGGPMRKKVFKVRIRIPKVYRKKVRHVRR